MAPDEEDAGLPPEVLAQAPDASAPVYEKKPLPWHRQALLSDPRVQAAQARVTGEAEQLAWDRLRDPAIVLRALEVAKVTPSPTRYAEAARIVCAQRAKSFEFAERYFTASSRLAVAAALSRHQLDLARAELKPIRGLLRAETDAFLCEVIRHVQPHRPATFAAPAAPAG